jgi:hypothetical protein
VSKFLENLEIALVYFRLKYFFPALVIYLHMFSGLYGSALMLIILSFSSSNPTTGVIILTVAVACNAGCLIGYSANYLDLTTNFTATIAGLANAAACVMCIIGPLLVGFIVTDNVS